MKFWNWALALLMGVVFRGYAEEAAHIDPVKMVRVTIEDLGEVDRLTAAGFNVSSVKGAHITIHATGEELARLQSLGYPFEELEGPKLLGVYPSFEEITALLVGNAETHSGISRLVSIGKSIEGRDLWAILITDDPDFEEDEPEFKYVSTAHGDEPVGTVLCLNFIEMLLTSYGADPRVTELVDSTAIWVVPLMNPDGYERASRFNAGGLDLNRDFPVYSRDFIGTIFDGAPLLTEGRQAETAHIMQWTAQNSFVLSANIHSGALVVNYPYDDNGGPSGVDQPTPDDLLFEELSLRYARHNPPMSASDQFPNGITNGAAWFVIKGGMQDWMYRYAGCFEVTLEVCETRAPYPSELTRLWADNAESMLAYLEGVHIGVRGLVHDAKTGAPLYAKVMVEGNTQPVFTDPDVGDYHRLLLPGAYALTFHAQGYVTGRVTNIPVAEGPATRVDVALEPVPACPLALVFDNQPLVLARLRGLRDDVLARSQLGRIFVNAYYSAAPYLARRVAVSPAARDVLAVAASPFARFDISI